VTLCALVAPADGGPACGDELSAYDRWLAPIRADFAAGARMADHVDRLVAIPLQGAGPEYRAMTLVVDDSGVHDGNGPARSADQAGQLIAANRNLQWSRDHSNAIAHGIVVEAIVNAPASSVRAALVAAGASREDVWLEFRASNASAAAPPVSRVTETLSKVDSHDVGPLVQLITNEFAKCPDLMKMMQGAADASEGQKVEALITKSSPAMSKCACATSPDVVASILWTMALKDLGVYLPVQRDAIAKLPFSAGKTWKDAAPAVVKALGAKT
jgi:hypothetical protein